MNYCYVSLLYSHNNKCDYLEGMINYPFLKNILFNNLKLIIADNLINFKDIDNIFISFLHPNLQTIFNIKYK